MCAWWNKFIPSKNDRELTHLYSQIVHINKFEKELKKLSNAELIAKTAKFRTTYENYIKEHKLDIKKRFSSGTKEELKAEREIIDAALNHILPEVFATVREVAWRVLKMRHYDVQLIGGIVLHQGKIAEMRTGEGKTLVATLPVYLNAIANRGVHVVTVNEYLASRDALWMGEVYRFLEMDVGILTHNISDSERKKAYESSITYGTNSEFGFDYLRDNMKLQISDYMQRGSHFSIVDEVDSILIDEARTPLIISGPAEDSTDKYIRINTIIPSLRREQDYTLDEKARVSILTELGVHSVEKKINIENLYDPENIEILHHVNQALRAHTLYKRDVDYMVQENKVKIIDDFTGRVLDGRRWSDGLHQAIEAKEGVKIENENQTLATITYQNYFRMFMKLAGMTGTAETESEEFSKIYDLDVIVIPTNKPIIREDHDDMIYRTEKEKFHAIAEDIQIRSTEGQPILVGTVSVEKSEVLSKRLKYLKITHNVLNAKYHESEAEIIAQAGRKSAVTIATNMAGRGTDILLGGNPEFLTGKEYDIENDPENFEKSLKEYQQKCFIEKEEVLKAGGLHIIGTERHESRRIDNQLRGRSGRQGDPGSSRFYLSLEDNLLRIFGSERLVSMMQRLGMQENEVIEHAWVNKSIANAQKKVEGHNFDIRKNLLEYDDVMNEQRKAVYKLRRKIINADIPKSQEIILDVLENTIIDLVSNMCPKQSYIEDWNLKGLEDALKEFFATSITFDTIQDIDIESLEDYLYKKLQHILDEKENLYGTESFYGIARIIYLQTIDKLWKEHLLDMDHLREGIGLRGYAQKDPKQEYKKEGYNLFSRMMNGIGPSVLQKFYRVTITENTEDDYQTRLEAQQKRQQQQMTLGNSKSLKKPVTVRRENSKVGRNEPCPCGSGKKYKKCCLDINN